MMLLVFFPSDIQYIYIMNSIEINQYKNAIDRMMVI